MSSSSPSSSSPPSLRNRKRSAKALENETATPDGWMPKIRIINFDPNRRQEDRAIKQPVLPPVDRPNPSPTEVPPFDAPGEEERAISAILPPEPDPILVQAAPPQTSPAEQPSASAEPERVASNQWQPRPIAPAPPRQAGDETPYRHTPLEPPRLPIAPPQTLFFNKVPVHPSDPLYPLLTCAKFCENCKTSETSYWRTDDEGRDHCNPCGLHWTKHRTPRPIHQQPQESGGKLMNFACQICPTRKHARKREEYHGVILCNACADYWKRNNAVRPLIAFAKRPKPGHGGGSSGIGGPIDLSLGAAAAVPRTRKCANCGTGRSSRWMPGPGGEENCSECGLFWMYHNMRRPLGVGVGIDVIGPKRESRGPKIMETKKRRRLGSVHTGSGSDEEMDLDVKEDMDEGGGPPRTRAAERRELAEKMGKMNLNGVEMKAESPEPPDNTPISLLNLAILARKVQRTPLLPTLPFLFLKTTALMFPVQLHELALLNSSLLRRQTIQALVAVIEPLVTELSPLSEEDLTSFTRSSISHGVLQNLLAHVTVAEADAFSSESERRRIVEGDIDFGPDNVGDNFLDGPVQNDDIVAASGLIDLFKRSFPDSSTEATMSLSSEEDVESAVAECRGKIMALLSEANTQSPKDVLSDVIEVSLVDGETSPKILVSGFFSSAMREEVLAIASEYQFPVIFEMDQLGDDVFRGGGESSSRERNLDLSV